MGATLDVFERWRFVSDRYFDLFNFLLGLEFPNAWELERALDSNNIDKSEAKKDESDLGLDSVGEESDMEDNSTNAMIHQPDRAQSTLRPSRAYEEFLRFLESGCAGSPLQGYPAVMVVVSTIPSSVCFPLLFFPVGRRVLMYCSMQILLSLPVPTPSEPEPAPSAAPSQYTTTPLTNFFNSFWKVLDTRVFSGLPSQRSAASAAFLSALLECLVFFVRRVHGSGSGGKDHSGLVLPIGDGHSGMGEVRSEEVEGRLRDLVKQQMGRVWKALAADSKTVGLRVDQRAAARLVGQTLVVLWEVDKGSLPLILPVFRRF